VSDPSENASTGEEAATAAIEALLGPLARLAVDQGITVAVIEEALRRAFVESAKRALVASGLPEHRLVSRISTSTGLTRREVTRLNEELARGVKVPGGSLAAEVFTRWVTDRSLKNTRGKARPLPRTGPAPSFEALARSVTQDVHPRTLLDELCRLGMAQLDEGSDTVSLLKTAFVPDGDQQQMLHFLAANVGDHLSGAVSNVMGRQPRSHFDQAVFADELSAESLPMIHEFVASQWKRLLNEAVPMLEQRIEADKQAGRVQDKRIRIGLYGYEDDMPGRAEAGSAATDAAAPHKKPRRKPDHG
jgi:hypothetical protein